MAKALFGHVGLGPDVRVMAELRRLRDRVRELEADNARLRSANAALTSAVQVHDEMLTLSVPDTMPETAEAVLT
jgi:hypothetical protein